MKEKVSIDKLPKFEGTEDPLVHIRAFKGQMNLYGIEKEFWPSIFPQTLETVPQYWLYKLESRATQTWEQIAIDFDKQYADNIGI